MIIKTYIIISLILVIFLGQFFIRNDGVDYLKNILPADNSVSDTSDSVVNKTSDKIKKEIEIVTVGSNNYPVVDFERVVMNGWRDIINDEKIIPIYRTNGGKIAVRGKLRKHTETHIQLLDCRDEGFSFAALGRGFNSYCIEMIDDKLIDDVRNPHVNEFSLYCGHSQSRNYLNDLIHRHINKDIDLHTELIIFGTPGTEGGAVRKVKNKLFLDNCYVYDEKRHGINQDS